MMSTDNNQREVSKTIIETPRSFNSNFGIILYFIFSIGVFVVGIVTSESSDKNYSFFLWCLFFIPIIIHGVGWRALHQNRPNPQYKKSPKTSPSVREENKEQEGIDKFCAFYNVTMLVSVASYCIAWISYNKSGNFESGLWGWSVFCMISIIIQFGILCYVTYTIMEVSHKRAKFTRFLKIGLELSPFWRFAHFFAIFMSISFLFGFAFAFHDLEYRKIHKKAALLVENLASDEEVDKQNEEERKKKENPNSASTPTPILLDDVVNPQPLCFYFEKGKANMIFVKEEAGFFEPNNDKEQSEFNRFKKNFENLTTVITQTMENKSKGIIRLILIGSADDEPITRNSKNVIPSVKSSDNFYPSNYALSEARIQATKNEITKELYKQRNGEWQNIDWITVAHSNEEYLNQNKLAKSQIKKCQDINLEQESGKRAVAVYLNVVSLKQTAASDKIPNLMDYVYFSIYTISTTGYGDIKPATKYAKFLVSLENFFEVFFLVCFMNSLIALRSEPKIPSEIKSELPINI